MNGSSSDDVTTRLGRLHVDQAGFGPPMVLWHSLFLDSRSWGSLIDAFAAHRRVIVVDGPCHGRSGMPDHDFTTDDCAEAAAEVLDALRVTDPVDWVGNAWGGHVGILLALRSPDRVRTLTTIGTPLRALSLRERIAKVIPLVTLYRFTGANQFVGAALGDSLLGSEAVAAQPDQAQVTMDAFRRADRSAMLRAMRSVMLRRRSLEHLVSSVTVPTLMIAARDDTMGWGPADADKAVATMPNGRSLAVAGGGHTAPLLLGPDLIATTVLEFCESACR